MNSFTRNKVLFFLLTSLLLSALGAVYFNNFYLAILFVFFGLLSLFAILDVIQTKHTLLRNYPLIGRFRWLMERERSKIQQYFIEDDKNGTPTNRENRSDIYQKAKGSKNTTPLGTQLNVYEEGYECLKHSMYPKDITSVKDPRVIIGSSLCRKPYSASIFNISAMSFGSLSESAIKALNGGAKLGNFYHNTGEGGVSPHHLENKGDLCFQIGTGYFGAGQSIKGVRYFDRVAFRTTISNPSIKLIEIKLSQGAKPAHGGILPASKNTKEIAKIRGVEPHVDIFSPPYHTAFHDANTLLHFIADVRHLSNGLPVGIKLCLGSKKEFEDLVQAMKKLNIYPDFISIDGGEGGTGAAPLVFTNYIGMPLVDALQIIDGVLKEYGLRNEIKIIASGKATNSFQIIKLMALGADIVNAARAFMLSMGCIQARECNKNTCPVGIATQDKSLSSALNVHEKRVRVFNFHKAIINEVKEILAALGLTSTSEITKDVLLRRDNDGILKEYN